MTNNTDLNLTSPACLICRKLQWVEPIVLPNDRLNDQIVDISSPTPRGGHTCVALQASSKLMVFGGLAATHSDVKDGRTVSLFHPYASHQCVDKDYGKVTNDVYFYSFMDCVWQKVLIKGNTSPHPRMDHVAVALDAKRVWIFGGRDGEGQCFDDIWIFHDHSHKWERISDVLPCPTPRYAPSAALVATTGDIVMFGGRNLEACLGDLWVWSSSDQIWSSPLTVGVAPSPRYGHALVPVSDGRMLVLGGSTSLIVTAQEVSRSSDEVFDREFEVRT